MSDIAIKIENLSKVYKLYDNPVDRLKESLHPFRKKYHKDFYALKEVNFEVKKGETVGIIGKNGSGKSTLLKLITGVLTPSSGNVTINGKISALLELGAGFNPELTGIENVYFNATLMGYTREEIDAIIDNILSFADIGDFVYQPVKTYSSGMFVRLAFACAVNVDPDILIIDEALAVGDALFFQKCMRRFEQFKEQGTTILYVSHDTSSIKHFCHEAILLDNGEIIGRGYPKDIVDVYNAITAEKVAAEIRGEKIFSSKTVAEKRQESASQRYGTGEAEIFEVEILNADGITVRSFTTLEDTTIRIKAILKANLNNLLVGFSIRNRLRIDMYMINTLWKGIDLGSLEKGDILTVDFCQKMALGEGEYFLNVVISQDTPLGIQRLDWIADQLNFYVTGRQGERMGGFCNLDSKINFYKKKE